jgi:aryl carrier-like protein
VALPGIGSGWTIDPGEVARTKCSRYAWEDSFNGKETLMFSKITPEIQKKLEEIGFGEDEINMIRIVHDLKSRSYTIDLQDLIRRAAFENLSEGISQTFDENQWDEEDFFTVVGQHRNESRN